MQLNKRPTIIFTSIAALLLSLTSCSSKGLEGSLAADPNLKDNPVTFGASTQKTTQNPTLAKLPADFPDKSLIYPNAQLQEVKPDTQGEQTIWTTADASNLVQSFYQKAFTTNGWQIVSQPTNDNAGNLIARRNNLQVTLSINSPTDTSAQTSSPSPTVAPETTQKGTKFIIDYSRNDVSSQPTATPSTPTQDNLSSASVFNDLNKAPAQLRPYIEDLAALGVLTPDKAASKSNQFDPSKIISRRLYLRWLLAANNQMYANDPGKQIRLASPDAQPAYPDIPRSDRDFPVIQGLAEAGLIPSPLSGDSTAVLFKPDAPLTRENLILWKVPLDTRRTLPSASLEAVKQSWGFEDTSRINPKALRAVLADYQNGDQSNIRRVFGYTTLLQPQKPVTRAEVAAALWYFGSQGEGVSAKDALLLKNQKSPSPTPEASPSNSVTQ